MTQILYKFLPITSHQKKLIIKAKTTPQTQPKVTPLFYLRLILILHNHLRQIDTLVKITTHLLFHLNLRLLTTSMISLNKVLLIFNAQIQSTFKHQLHPYLLKYNLQLILQLKIIQYKMSKRVQILTLSAQTHIPTTQLLDIFLDLRYNLY